MNDDYLWDGSGEPDPDIEHHENLLGRYRSSQPAPQMPSVVVAPVVRLRWTRPFAAIAAAVLLAVGSIYVWQHATVAPQVAEIQTPAVVPTTPKEPQPSETPNEPPSKTTETEKANRPSPRRLVQRVTVPRDQQAVEQPKEPAIRPLMDVATALHLEQAEYLLRSFRNAQPGDESSMSELALDARQSRELLNQNVLLRRNAEVRGNLSAEQILGDLEPFLIDIANLEPRPSSDDVASIQERIQKKEIVADLQLYSSNRSTTGF